MSSFANLYFDSLATISLLRQLGDFSDASERFDSDPRETRELLRANDGAPGRLRFTARTGSAWSSMLDWRDKQKLIARFADTKTLIKSSRYILTI
jgi:hypothetical protein